jgi:uncharacterized protein YjbJ (UPF0337 family)
MGRKRRDDPEGALDKTAGRLGEAAGRATGDKSLEAEGRAMRRKGEPKTYLVRPTLRRRGGRSKLRGLSELPACTARKPRRWRQRRRRLGAKRRAKSWSTSRMG